MTSISSWQNFKRFMYFQGALWLRELPDRHKTPKYLDNLINFLVNHHQKCRKSLRESYCLDFARFPFFIDHCFPGVLTYVKVTLTLVGDPNTALDEIKRETSYSYYLDIPLNQKRFKLMCAFLKKLLDAGFISSRPLLTGSITEYGKEHLADIESLYEEYNQDDIALLEDEKAKCCLSTEEIEFLERAESKTSNDIESITGDKNFIWSFHRLVLGGVLKIPCDIPDASLEQSSVTEFNSLQKSD